MGRRRIKKLWKKVNCFSRSRKETAVPNKKQPIRYVPPPTVSFQLPKNVTLSIVKGSVTHFECRENGAIVNATNALCLGGGGVDGAINRLGGAKMISDRLLLPVLEEFKLANSERSLSIRCKTGTAVVTGPNEYGSLRVPYVIHAAGPSYRESCEFETPDQQLKSTYIASLDCCREKSIQQVAFSLISAGIYRGDRNLTDVVRGGVIAIRDWVVESKDVGFLQRICLYAYKKIEFDALVLVCAEELETEVCEEELKRKC
jgi:O-acetyl-ADP-ribose deacetylase (regulator of RNase III)